jgi:ribonuclease-3
LSTPLDPFHRFDDPDLGLLALTHSSSGTADARGRKDNERLEFLGDTVLDLVIAEALYGDRDGHPEGALTEMKAQVVSRQALAGAAHRMGLADHARLGRGLDRRALSRSILANLYEAVVGAIYLDAGLEAARHFILETLGPELSAARQRRGRPKPKQRFQEVCQQRYGSPPTYELLQQRGDDNARAFLVAAAAGGERFPSAWGRTVKEAEHWAAFEALLDMGLDAHP